ncbi:hypothetical protein ACFOPX_03375 [Helicobacter baculiformis]|uniref:Uncharacterized protein n=1 Tax=Helicobacter baculiformis TaxID=427351 RepID=A0ABV7ZJE5_9HELI|nr:hypothetical protein [Helicobacter baculiformis]
MTEEEALVWQQVDVEVLEDDHITLSRAKLQELLAQAYHAGQEISTIS